MYVVPFKKVFRVEKVPIVKWFLKDEKTREVESKVVGHKKEKVPNGLTPDVEYADLILDFESGKENLYDYKVELDSKKRVVGFKKYKK